MVIEGNTQRKEQLNLEVSDSDEKLSRKYKRHLIGPQEQNKTTKVKHNDRRSILDSWVQTIWYILDKGAHQNKSYTKAETDQE